MDMALEATHQRGKYQLYLIFIVIMLPITTNILAAGYPYLTNIPTLNCKPKAFDDNSSFGYSKCDMDTYCENQDYFDIQIDSLSIDSLSKKFNLYCDRAFYSPLINSFYFLGAVIGVMICANYPDKIGRLPVLKALMLINVFIQVNYLFSISIQHVLVITFLSGFCTYSNSVLSLLIVETMDSNLSGIVMSARSATYGLVGIILAIYFMTINSLFLLFLLTVIISIASYLLVHQYFVESARWLNSKNKIDEAIECLKQMAMINNSTEQLNIFLEVNNDLLQGSKKEIAEIKESMNLIQIFMLKSQQHRLMSLIFVWYFITVCFYGLYTSLNKTSGNIFTKTIVTYTAEIIAEMSSGILANKYGRVKILESMSYLGGITFIFSDIISNEFQTLKSLLLFGASFGFSGAFNLLYIYTNEILPFSIKSLSFGFLYLISRFGGICVPIFLKTSQYPLILGMLSICCGILIRNQEETLGRKLEDDVPEAVRTYSVLSLASYTKDNVELIKISFKKKTPGLTSDRYRLSFINKQPITQSVKY